MKNELYERFNAMTDQQRFDMMSAIKDSVERGFIPLDGTASLAIQINANWGGSWGVDGSDSPHPNMNVIGMLSKVDEDGESVFRFDPFGERSHTTRVNKNHFFVVNNVPPLDVFLQSQLATITESIDLNRWGKLAGLLKG